MNKESKASKRDNPAEIQVQCHGRDLRSIQAMNDNCNLSYLESSNDDLHNPTRVYPNLSCHDKAKVI